MSLSGGNDDKTKQRQSSIHSFPHKKIIEFVMNNFGYVSNRGFVVGLFLLAYLVKPLKDHLYVA